MITEFTCGIYQTQYISDDGKWAIKANEHIIAWVFDKGATILFVNNSPYLTDGDLLEMLVLMNNIKRQYKQLQLD